MRQAEKRRLVQQSRQPVTPTQLKGSRSGPKATPDPTESKSYHRSLVQVYAARDGGSSYELRCGGTKPTYAMPPGLRDGIIRLPERPDLPPAMHARWSLLVGACR